MPSPQILPSPKLDATYRVGVQHHQAGRLREAEQAYRQVLSHDPDHADALQMFAVVAYQTGHPDPAIEMLSHLASQLTRRGDVHTHLAMAYEIAGRFDEAESSLRRALDCPDAPPVALGNLANILRQLWRSDEAELLFRQAVALRPDDAYLRYCLASHLLGTGAIAEGWREFEQRLLAEPPPPSTIAPWAGDSLDRRRLRVTAEQGFGDTLLFARFLPHLPPDALIEVEVQPELARLIQQSFPRLAVAPVGAFHTLPDIASSLLSLPAKLASEPREPRGAEAYLRVDPATTAAWRERLREAEGLKVGLVWAGGSRPGRIAVQAVDQRRSLPFSAMAPILAVPHVAFVSLQKDNRPGNAAARSPLLDWTDELKDFADTAALVSQLDLVISVDTAVAHLAGALGKPVWVLSRADSCWRWPAGGRPEWYASARQFRQDEPGAWAPVIAEVAQALAAWAG